jgi:GNT-I family.
MELAPVVLFVYARPQHTKKTLEALQKNDKAESTDLIIYSDGHKFDQNRSQVQEVRNYLKTVSGFKSIKVIERDKNWGLAANIIDGVSEVINHYGKVIVMEDDIVTSPSYLSFMNQALEHYQNENKVWHISGWNYPIEVKGLDDAFFGV